MIPTWKLQLRQLKRNWRREAIAEGQRQALRAGAREYLAQSPARGLLNLAKKSGYHKGEVVDITPRQFRALFGYGPKSSVLNSQGKVPWEYCFDQLATEKGVGTDQELKQEIEYALRLRRRYG
mgnify:CR=1 FL=1